jgi:hypothetical protein
VQEPQRPAEVALTARSSRVAVRTVVKEEESFRVLPIALAGAALIVAIAGSAYAVARIAPVLQQLRGQH